MTEADEHATAEHDAAVTGSLTILNVGAGDIEIRFNPHEPAETARALAMLKDMQARGYAILVKQDDGSYVRAVEIDASRGLYILTGEATPAPPGDPDVGEPPVTVRRGARRGRRSAPIATSEAVGVGRSAGG